MGSVWESLLDFEVYLRAGGHVRASLGVANGSASGRVHLLNNPEHTTKDTELLGHFVMLAYA